MRTTLSLDDNLLREAKERAARSGRTLSQVVEDALRESLHRVTGVRPPVARLPVDTIGGGLRPGVSLDNNAALRDLLDDDLDLSAGDHGE